MTESEEWKVNAWLDMLSNINNTMRALEDEVRSGNRTITMCRAAELGSCISLAVVYSVEAAEIYSRLDYDDLPDTEREIPALKSV